MKSRRSTMMAIPHTRRAGVALASVTACVSGLAVFVNGYGVTRWPDATVYTTAKNLVAAVILVSTLLVVTRGRPRTVERVHRSRGTRVGLLAIAVIGGSVPFVLFFEGLARASSTDAAFIHKTLLIWVVLLAVPLLHERTGLPHIAAVALLVAGQAALTGGVPDVESGAGEWMILAATLLWAVETVLAKRLLTTVAPLTLGVVRMGGGVAVLVAWLAVRGDLPELAQAGLSAWGWAVLTGVLLAAYVATWFSALARAQAVDVTAVLVIGALVTAALDTIVRGLPTPEPAGLILVAVGGALAILASLFGERPIPRAAA